MNVWRLSKDRHKKRVPTCTISVQTFEFLSTIFGEIVKNKLSISESDLAIFFPRIKINTMPLELKVYRKDHSPNFSAVKKLN
jgi:hypothetical protein